MQQAELLAAFTFAIAKQVAILSDAEPPIIAVSLATPAADAAIKTSKLPGCDEYGSVGGQLFRPFQAPPDEVK